MGRSVISGRANWGEQFHKIFVESCYEQTLRGNKPGTIFNREGWSNIVESFHRNSGIRYERIQLKNHWDVTKKQWQVWCDLIGTSYMKWDSDTNNFGASDEDWAIYLKEHPEAAQFRHNELLFANKLETIFHGIVYTSESKQYNSSSTSYSFIKDPDPISVHYDPSNALPLDTVESKSDTTTNHYEHHNMSFSIGECIVCLDNMTEIEAASDLYLFALDLFLKKECREIFLQLKKDCVRYAWLKRQQIKQQQPVVSSLLL